MPTLEPTPIPAQPAPLPEPKPPVKPDPCPCSGHLARMEDKLNKLLRAAGVETEE